MGNDEPVDARCLALVLQQVVAEVAAAIAATERHAMAVDALLLAHFPTAGDAELRALLEG